jgi:hypothetical protein
MQITIELSEDIAVGLQSKWKDLPRAALDDGTVERGTRSLSTIRNHLQGGA